MEKTFITELHICKLRHLKDITIPLSAETRKNVILTGKNGSGKTSVLDSLAEHLEYVISGDYDTENNIREFIAFWEDQLDKKTDDHSDGSSRERDQIRRNIAMYNKGLAHWTGGCVASFTSVADLREKYAEGRYIIAYYGDKRKIHVSEYKNIEKVELKPIYGISETPSNELGKYLVNLKSTQAFAREKGDAARADEIASWFTRFENILKRLYHDDTLKLDFDIDTFQFSILLSDREPFTFNTMSMGYAAIFDIIGDLIMRMERQRTYALEGAVLIDEIETHLHVELQKEIVPILSTLFPNIQFILTTHSPFILNSTQNAVVYDLEQRTLVADGLTDLPYDGIVEGYFNADLLSQELREKFEEYKRLTALRELSDADFAKIAELEYYLDEIPDYLAVDFADEYTSLKSDFKSRV